MKVTLITGASSGIGKAFARHFAAEKKNVFLVARSEDKLRWLCNELSEKQGIKAYYLAIDLVKPNADYLVFEETKKLGLEIEVLINNAGIGSAGYFSELELQSELDMLSLNIHALVALTHRFLPQMRERNDGMIINVSSMACFQPIPYMACYSASKTFVRYFTEAIAAENLPFNIKIMALCPGATDTNFFEAAKLGESSKKAMGITKIQTPEEVVDAAIKGISNGKGLTISGTKNRIGAYLSRILPNKLITFTIAKRFRGKFEGKN